MTGVLDYYNLIAEKHNLKSNDQVSSLKNVSNLIAKHEEELSKKFLEYLNSRNDIKIIGSISSNSQIRVPTFSFIIENQNSKEITLKTDEHNIGIRYGDFYAHRLITDLGLREYEGPVRVSMVHYNTEEEVERLVEVFEAVSR